ncbi:MAG: phosphoglycerate kinase [Candidatus Bathyarchaeia archaeon]
MGAKSFLTLDDFDVKGKTVIVRVDVNSPVDAKTHSITDDSRLRQHAVTLDRLLKAGAKVVVLAHQGRRGEPDFISLKAHAETFSKLLGRSVKYVDDIFGGKARREIRSLKEGEVLVLENVRFWPEETREKTPEEHAQSALVKNLAPLADLFVNDAFAAAHRAHASMVGFTAVLPSAAGPVMEGELNALRRVHEAAEKPCVYVLGGAKADDAVEMTSAVLGRGIADKVLPCGVIGQVFLKGRGLDLGVPNESLLKDKGYDKYAASASKLLAQFGEKIQTPLDVAVKLPTGGRDEVLVDDLPTRYPIQDIGRETIQDFSRILRGAKTIVISGPAGVYEEPGFEAGTRAVFEASVRSGAFVVIGGGHTVAAAEEFGYADKVSYVSTAGGAFIEFLIKGTLPAIEALERAAQRRQIQKRG